MTDYVHLSREAAARMDEIAGAVETVRDKLAQHRADGSRTHSQIIPDKDAALLADAAALTLALPSDRLALADDLPEEVTPGALTEALTHQRGREALYAVDDVARSLSIYPVWTPGADGVSRLHITRAEAIRVIDVFHSRYRFAQTLLDED